MDILANRSGRHLNNKVQSTFYNMHIDGIGQNVISLAWQREIGFGGLPIPSEWPHYLNTGLWSDPTPASPLNHFCTAQYHYAAACPGGSVV